MSDFDLNHQQLYHHKDRLIHEEHDYQLKSLDSQVVPDILNGMKFLEKGLENEEYVIEENHRDNHMLDHLEIFHKFVMELLFDVLLMQQAIEY